MQADEGWVRGHFLEVVNIAHSQINLAAADLWCVEPVNSSILSIPKACSAIRIPAPIEKVGRVQEAIQRGRRRLRARASDGGHRSRTFDVLDKDLRVVAASRSFYVRFSTDPEDTQGRHFYELGDGEWDIPKLRLLLEKIIPDHGAMDEYEVEHDFTRIGRRVMLLNARIVRYEKAHTNILLGIEDVTVQRNLEREKDELLRQKDVLLDEIQHRVANSLQIIASIIMMKALSVESEDTRRHLHDAHTRVISIAAVQQHLHASVAVGSMEMHPYLSKLCEALAHSMIGEDQSISLKVFDRGGIATCRDAESLGLIVTELVINALKHAFNTDTKDGQINVSYEVSGTDWKLSVADNGIGKPDGVFAQPKSGLGTGIVKALAKQLDSQVVTESGPNGTTVSLTHATFAGREAQNKPAAA